MGMRICELIPGNIACMCVRGRLFLTLYVRKQEFKGVLKKMGFGLVDEPEPLTLPSEKARGGDALTWGRQEQESETDQVISCHIHKHTNS